MSSSDAPTTGPTPATDGPSATLGLAPARPIDVDVWADVVCPWCYIAKTRLRRAIDGWDRPHDVLVRHRAFELDPGMPRGGRGPVAAYLGERYGGGDAAGLAMTDRSTQVAADDGLQLDMGRARTANTYDAHRLIALAREMGGPGLEDAALERMFSAHFSEGLALDDHDTLLRCAAEAGMDERRVASVLADDTYGDVVRADEKAARELGASGVPFAVANDRVSVSGAQSVEVLHELLRAAAEPGPEPA
ncbi:MAG: DsbA family oxidoreductase [Lapillicoccus sp.]